MQTFTDPKRIVVDPTRDPTRANGIYFALSTFALASCWVCKFHVVCVNFTVSGRIWAYAFSLFCLGYYVKRK